MNTSALNKNYKILKRYKILILLFVFSEIFFSLNRISHASEKPNTLIMNIGLTSLAMINEICEPDKRTHEILTRLLSGSKVKEAENEIYTQKMLQKLHLEINEVTAMQDSGDNASWEKQTTTTIAALMLLSEAYDERGYGYYDLASRYLFYNISSASSVENLCVLRTMQFYMSVKHGRDRPSKIGLYFKKYKDSIADIRERYKKYIFVEHSAESTTARSGLESFDKHYSKMLGEMNKYDAK